MSSARMCPLAMAASVPVMQPLSSSTTMQQRIVRLAFAPPSIRRLRFSIAARPAAMPPFMSQLPRPQILPSPSAARNGSRDQPSPAGTVSM